MVVACWKAFVSYPAAVKTKVAIQCAPASRFLRRLERRAAVRLQWCEAWLRARIPACLPEDKLICPLNQGLISMYYDDKVITYPWAPTYSMEVGRFIYRSGQDCSVMFDAGQRTIYRLYMVAGALRGAACHKTSSHG